MAQTIRDLNKQLAEKAELKLKNAADPYSLYEARKKKDEKFEMTFPLSDADGNLYYIDENKIKIILPMEKLQATDRFYNSRLRGNYVGIKTLEVQIDKIDRENNIVYLKSGRSTENIVRAVERELYAEVNRRRELIRKGEQPEAFPVYGTVVSVDAARQNATVRLFNQNIYGTIHVSKWASSYTRSLPEGIEDDDMPRQFDLLGVTNLGGQRYFRLSGENYGNDAWREVPDEIFEPKAVVMVECLETPVGDNHWWGKCQGIGVEVIGNYSTKFKIEVGRCYLCTVKRSNSKNHTLIVTPFKYIRKEGETKESVAYLTKDDLKNLMEEKRKERLANEGTTEGSNTSEEQTKAPEEKKTSKKSSKSE